MDKGIGYSQLITDFIEAQYDEERLAFVLEKAEEWMPEFFTVKTEVVERNGLFIVNLIYVNIEDSTSFIRIPARVCRNYKIAQIIASYKCRLCACDQCIPLTVSAEDFSFSDN